MANKMINAKIKEARKDLRYFMSAQDFHDAIEELDKK